MDISYKSNVTLELKKGRSYRMKILQIIWDGTVGGAQSFLYSLLKELLKNNDLQIEVCFARQEGLIADKIKELKIPTYCLNMKNGFDLLGAFKLVRLIQKGKYNIVHSHSPQPLVRLMMALIKRRGSLLTEQGSILDALHGRHKPEIYYHRFLARFIHSYIAVSDSVKRGLMERHNIPERKIEIIPNALDLDSFCPREAGISEMRKKFKLPPSGPITGAIGRLSPVKGMDHLILATKHIIKKFPDCITLIVGDGETRKELENQANALGISENIFFLGEQTRIADIISMLDILVIPSVHEGLPLVALESMAMGKPIVAYNVKGISDIIVHNRTGLLVDRRDPLLLADKIMELLNDQSLRSHLGELGRKYVIKNFSIETVARRYKELYLEQLIEEDMFGFVEKGKI